MGVSFEEMRGNLIGSSTQHLRARGRACRLVRANHVLSVQRSIDSTNQAISTEGEATKRRSTSRVFTKAGGCSIKAMQTRKGPGMEASGHRCIDALSNHNPPVNIIPAAVDRRRYNIANGIQLSYCKKPDLAAHACTRAKTAFLVF